MTHTYHELKHMKVTELREIAAGMEDDAVQGHTQMHKDHLLEAICNVLHIDMHEHHEVVGVDKATIKSQIKAAKQKRDEALQKKDKESLISSRVEIKKLKHTLRRATV
ncbi:hypothetical protein HQ585_07715 [candidate division KSB1 bacterium]|nr:hypothetical protein [candidate division KSB1 bacterium]